MIQAAHPEGRLRRPSSNATDGEKAQWMYLAGVSVRRVEDITEALWGTRVNPNTVSVLNQKTERAKRHERPRKNFRLPRGGAEHHARSVWT